MICCYRISVGLLEMIILKYGNIFVVFFLEYRYRLFNWRLTSYWPGVHGMLGMTCFSYEMVWCLFGPVLVVLVVCQESKILSSSSSTPGCLVVAPCGIPLVLVRKADHAYEIANYTSGPSNPSPGERLLMPHARGVWRWHPFLRSGSEGCCVGRAWPRRAADGDRLALGRARVPRGMQK